MFCWNFKQKRTAFDIIHNVCRAYDSSHLALDIQRGNINDNIMTLERGLQLQKFDEMTKVKKEKNTKRKSVRFADDYGYLLVKNFNQPTVQKKQDKYDKFTTPARKLSKVTNFTECQKDLNDLIYLESTATTKAAVFGTLVVQDKTIDTDLLRVVYSWDSKTSRTSNPFLVVPGETGRLLFKIPLPRIKSKSVEETRTLVVNFYITYKGKRLNNGKDFVVTCR